VLRHEGDPSRCVVILPGVRYFSQAPLLWFAREAAQAGGWSVLEVDERAPQEREPFEWMLEQAERALGEVDAERLVVVGKSLGSVAATIVSGPAVWLTPLLNQPRIVAALEATRSPTLLVGSPADPTWGDGTVPGNPALEVLELEGLDHSLQVSGDPTASLRVLGDVTQRLRAFLDAASPPAPA
jgi:hypothetical protein